MKRGLIGTFLTLLVALAGAAPATPASLPAPDRVSLESVSISGPSDVTRLERLGFDVTHDVTPTTASVVLDSDAERARLRAAGFDSEVLVADLAAKNAAERRAEGTSVAASTLPSGRDTYRVYDDYVNEINAIAQAHPDFARKVTIGETIEGRDIIGLEFASEVNREDDGRPVYLNLGLHHAREWPSGEFPMEFAIDLANGYGSDSDITELLDNTRVMIFPVVNVDGFIVSRGAAASDLGGAGGVVSGGGEYRRKNCRPPAGAPPGQPCALRSANTGIDLNRNYGYYWGGPGTSTSQTAETYRGTGPFSEPEAEAVHELSSRIHPTVVISNHTYTERGWWLRQPGFNASFFPQEASTYSDACLTASFCSVTPDEPAMKALGDAMGDEGMDVAALGATGWPSDLGWELGDITGATEDWNYFAQGSYGYTPEARGLDFHTLYPDAVVEEYEGDASHMGEGVREAYLIAGEYARNPIHHGIISGPAPAGATLHLRKSFTSPRHPNQGAAPGTPEQLHTTLKVAADGNYSWHVGPSNRPLEPPESWSMTCVRAGETVESPPVAVNVARNEIVPIDWVTGSACGDPPIEPNLPPVADFDFSPSAPVTGEEIAFISTSTDPDGAIATTEWDLDGDGTEDFADATGLVATTTFGTAGTYPIRVRVTDDDNEQTVETRNVVVSAPPPNQAPFADFDFSPSAPAASQDIQFSSSSTDQDGTLATFLWDFDNDGQFDDGSGSQVTRAFLAVGTYPVSLEVTDDDGATDAVTRNVVVGQPSGSGSQSTARPRCQGRTATILGTGDGELLRGTNGNDVIVALGGDDRVRARGGNDLVCGGHGRDRIGGGPGVDILLGGRGADRVRGGGGGDRCRGGLGHDLLSSC